MNEPPPVTARADGYVQDLASQWVAEWVGAEPGHRVADLCAAPGGKATRLAERASPAAFVVAADLRPHRARLIAANAERLRAGQPGRGRRRRHRAAARARQRSTGSLVDAPCSGLGALRRRPDARWRIAGGRHRASWPTCRLASWPPPRPLVRPGGMLVYSVCTLTAAESIDHAAARSGGSRSPPPGPPWRPVRRRRLACCRRTPTPTAWSCSGTVVRRDRAPNASAGLARPRCSPCPTASCTARGRTAPAPPSSARLDGRGLRGGRPPRRGGRRRQRGHRPQRAGATASPA